jgi:hypothetical protein
MRLHNTVWSSEPAWNSHCTPGSYSISCSPSILSWRLYCSSTARTLVLNVYNSFDSYHIWVVCNSVYLLYTKWYSLGEIIFTWHKKRLASLFLYTYNASAMYSVADSSSSFSKNCIAFLNLHVTNCLFPSLSSCSGIFDNRNLIIFNLASAINLFFLIKFAW